MRYEPHLTLADIQKKWLEFYLRELRLLKDINVYKIITSVRDRK